jgi:hypothetical protein
MADDAPEPSARPTTEWPEDGSDIPPLQLDDIDPMESPSDEKAYEDMEIQSIWTARREALSLLQEASLAPESAWTSVRRNKMQLRLCAPFDLVHKKDGGRVAHGSVAARLYGAEPALIEGPWEPAQISEACAGILPAMDALYREMRVLHDVAEAARAIAKRGADGDESAVRTVEFSARVPECLFRDQYEDGAFLSGTLVMITEGPRIGLSALLQRQFLEAETIDAIARRLIVTMQLAHAGVQHLASSIRIASGRLCLDDVAIFRLKASSHEAEAADLSQRGHYYTAMISDWTASFTNAEVRTGPPAGSGRIRAWRGADVSAPESDELDASPVESAFGAIGARNPVGTFEAAVEEDKWRLGCILLSLLCNDPYGPYVGPRPVDESALQEIDWPQTDRVSVDELPLPPVAPDFMTVEQRVLALMGVLPNKPRVADQVSRLSQRVSGALHSAIEQSLEVPETNVTSVFEAVLRARGYSSAHSARLLERAHKTSALRACESLLVWEDRPDLARVVAEFGPHAESFRLELVHTDADGTARAV